MKFKLIENGGVIKDLDSSGTKKAAIEALEYLGYELEKEKTIYSLEKLIEDIDNAIEALGCAKIVIVADGKYYEPSFVSQEIEAARIYTVGYMGLRDIMFLESLEEVKHDDVEIVVGDDFYEIEFVEVDQEEEVIKIHTTPAG